MIDDTFWMLVIFPHAVQYLRYFLRTPASLLDLCTFWKRKRLGVHALSRHRGMKVSVSALPSIVFRFSV